MPTKTPGYWVIAIAALGSMTAAVAAAAGADKEGDFKFRFVGPHVGNRIAAVAGVPGDTSVYYAGAASGGVWKSTDGGNRWAPIFDKQTVAAIGALAVSPSEPGTVWAGTGEAWVIRDSDVMGNGIYQSTDAGETWTTHGARRLRTHRPHHRASLEPRHRIRVRARPRHRAAAGARRVSHDRRRAALGSGCCSRARTSAARACRSMLTIRTP